MKHPPVSRPYGRSRNRSKLNGRSRRELTPVKREKRPKRFGGTTVIAAIREYLSDILGAFMPGVYFSLNLLVSAVLFLFMVKGLTWNNIVDFVGLPQSAVLDAAGPFAVFAFCLFSYIIGSAFCLTVFSGIQLGIASYIRRSIKQYFHYMRVREILFLLEIADTVNRSTGRDMFEGLEPDKTQVEDKTGNKEE
jgi:hypothetical protein